METVEVPDRFEDQEVRCGGGDDDVGGGAYRSVVQVRGDLGVVGFRDRRDLSGLEDAAHPGTVHLGDVERAAGEERGELVAGDEAFAGRYRDIRAGSDVLHRCDVVRWYGFFEPQRFVRGDPVGQPQRTCGRELSMGSEEDVGVAADRLSNRRDHRLGQVETNERGHARITGEVASHRIELHRGVALGHIGSCHLGGDGRLGVHAGVGVDVLGGIGRVQVGVGAKPVGHAVHRAVR